MMKNTDRIEEYLWREINPLLYEFADRLVHSESDVKFTIGQNANEAFFIRGYVSFTKTGVDNEVAIMVDGMSRGGEIHLSADACLEDGEIVADGPNACVVPSIISIFDETLFSDWLNRFEEFLANIEAVVRERIDGMST